MAVKNFNSRIQLKNDSEARWSSASNFIPKLGEMIIYNPDLNNPRPRLKVGDGITAVTALPFVTVPEADVDFDEILARVQPKIWKTSIFLDKDNWESIPITLRSGLEVSQIKYQEVTIQGTTDNSLIELLLDSQLITNLSDEGIDSIWVENDNGDLTVKITGIIPTTNLTIPCLIIEVSNSPYIIADDGTIQIDNELSASSDNPIKNKAVYAAIQDIQEQLDNQEPVEIIVDATPTLNSDNPVSSNGVKVALNGKQDTLIFDNTPTNNSDNLVKSGAIYTALQNVSVEVDATPTLNSNNPVSSNGVKGALNTKQDILEFETTPTTNSQKIINSGNLKTLFDNKQDTLSFETTPTSNSTKLINSGNLKTLFDNKQNKLTFDSTPTSGSSNPVTSGGVYTALSNKAPSTITYPTNGSSNPPQAGGTYTWFYNLGLTIAPLYTTGTNYAVGSYCTHLTSAKGFLLYRCNTAITNSGTWDSSYWTQISIEEMLTDLIPTTTTTISSSSTHNQIPTAKAVWDFIQSLDANNTEY